MRYIALAISIVTVLAILFAAHGANAQALRIMTAPQGGTGIGSAAPADVGDCLKVADDSPFTYQLDTCGGAGTLPPFATTTSTVSGQAIVYPLQATDILTIGSNATTSAEFWYDPNAAIGSLSGKLGIATTSPMSPLTVEMGTEAQSVWVGNSGSTSPAFVVRGVNGNGHVGIGTSTPAAPLSIQGAVTGLFRAVNTNTSAAGSGAGFNLYSDDGAALASGDRLGGFFWGGNDGTNTGGTMPLAAAITGFAAENWTSTTRGSYFAFETTLIGGSTRAERMRLYGDKLGIGTTSPYSLLSIAGGTSGTALGVDMLSGYTGNILELKVASTTVFSINQAGAATGSFIGSLTGNASTATALAADPSDCAADRYATAINASGTLTCGQVTNAGLANSTVSYGGVTLSLGGSDATPAFDLTDAINYPVASLSGLGSGVGTWLATPSSANLAAALTGETGSGAAVFGTSPTFTTNVSFGTAGVRLTDDADGAITFLGLGDGSDEDLTLNLDDTSNTAVWSSSTGVATSTFTSMGLQAVGLYTSTFLRVVNDIITDITGFGLAIANGALGLDTTGAADEECLTYESTGPGIEWQSCANALDVQTFNADGTWTKPSSGTRVLVQAWGGGGSGGSGSNTNGGGGGGGGSYVEMWFSLSSLGSTETVDVGAGGAAVSGSALNGNAGSNTTFGTWVTAYGGARGGGATGGLGGGGGAGVAGAGGNPGAASNTGGIGGIPNVSTTTATVTNVTGVSGDSGGGFGGGAGSTPGSGGMSVWGGGGGGGGDDNAGGTGIGGNSIWGGAGGGGGAGLTAGSAGGTSRYGGAGGAGSFDSGTATSGSQPGGGGGGTENGTSGAGGDGRVIVTVF